MSDRKGLRLEVYRPADGQDCTNGGMTSRVRYVTVTGIREDWMEPDKSQGVRPLPEDCRTSAPKDDAPEVILVTRRNGAAVDWVHLEPAEPCPKGLCGYLSGGNYAGTMDSRWREILGGHRGEMVRVHDRSETWQQYDMLTR